MNSGCLRLVLDMLSHAFEWYGGLLRRARRAGEAGLSGSPRAPARQEAARSENSNMQAARARAVVVIGATPCDRKTLHVHVFLVLFERNLIKRLTRSVTSNTVAVFARSALPASTYTGKLTWCLQQTVAIMPRGVTWRAEG